MIFISRSDKNIISRWWWTIDHWNLLQIVVLAAIGSILMYTVGAKVAEKHNLPELYFFTHHIYYLIISLFSMIFATFLSSKGIIRLSVVGFILCLVLLLMVILFAPDKLGSPMLISIEKNGASRWLIIGNASIQPSEFIKPFFVIITAYLISNQHKILKFIPSMINSFHISLLLLFIILAFLLKQPDIGMSVIIILIWSGQLFLSQEEFFERYDIFFLTYIY